MKYYIKKSEKSIIFIASGPARKPSEKAVTERFCKTNRKERTKLLTAVTPYALALFDMSLVVFNGNGLVRTMHGAFSATFAHVLFDFYLLRGNVFDKLPHKFSEEVRELDFSDYKFPTLYNLSNMTFYSCEFDNSEMYLSELDNVVFCCCTFKNFTFQYMSLNYVKFLSCRDTVSFEKIFDSKFQSVRFEDSVIEIKELTDSTFNSCELKDTILSPEQYKSYFRVV